MLTCPIPRPGLRGCRTKDFPWYDGIGMIGVSPDYRGRGISGTVLLAGMEYLRFPGCSRHQVGGGMEQYASRALIYFSRFRESRRTSLVRTGIVLSHYPNALE